MRVSFKSKKKGGEETILWRCTLPNCQHYLVDRMVLGKLCLCNRCNDEVFEMKHAHLARKKPHCLKCTKDIFDNFKGNKDRKEGPSITDILANLDSLIKPQEK